MAKPFALKKDPVQLEICPMPTRVLKILLSKICLVTIGFALSSHSSAQSNPYQSECEALQSKPEFTCAAYSNCRLIGGISEVCASQNADLKNTIGSNSLRRVMAEDEAKAAAERRLAAQDYPHTQKQNQEQQNRYFLQQQQLLQYRIDQINQQKQQLKK